jgi:hypothetical protein
MIKHVAWLVERLDLRRAINKRNEPFHVIFCGLMGSTMIAYPASAGQWVYIGTSNVGVATYVKDVYCVRKNMEGELVKLCEFDQKFSGNESFVGGRMAIMCNGNPYGYAFWPLGNTKAAEVARPGSLVDMIGDRIC